MYSCPGFSMFMWHSLWIVPVFAQLSLIELRMALLLKRLPVVPSIVCFPRPVLHPDRRSPNPIPIDICRIFVRFHEMFPISPVWPSLYLNVIRSWYVCFLNDYTWFPFFSLSEHESCLLVLTHSTFSCFCRRNISVFPISVLVFHGQFPDLSRLVSNVSELQEVLIWVCDSLKVAQVIQDCQLECYDTVEYSDMDLCIEILLFSESLSRFWHRFLPVHSSCSYMEIRLHFWNPMFSQSFWTQLMRSILHCPIVPHAVYHDEQRWISYDW